MDALQGYFRDQGVRTQAYALPVATLIGAALAIVLTALALGSAVTGGQGPNEPAALSLIGP